MNKVISVLGILVALCFIYFALSYAHFLVSTSAMSNSLQTGNYVLVKRNILTDPIPQRDLIFNFYFPLSDTVIEEIPYSYYEQEVRNTAVSMKVSADQAREILQQNYSISYNSISSRTPYVFRLIGMPGDNLQIKDSKVSINGTVKVENENYQFSYKVVTGGTGLNKEILFKRGVTKEAIIDLDSYGNYEMTLSAESVERVKSIEGVISVVRIIQPSGYEHTFSSYPIFPHHSTFDWSTDNFGPITIPKKGATVQLTSSNLPLYERIIRVYEGNDLLKKDGQIIINQQPTNSYTFKMDYFWMMGDNRHNSQDSRYWGFVPEDHLYGALVKILYSSSE